MYWYGNGMGGWGMALMALSTVVFWGLIVAGIVFAVRGVNRGGSADAAPSMGAEQILAQRYARGELSDEEYQQRLETLRRAASPFSRA